MWWYWKGDNPDPTVVAYMNKNYPSDWTYADFASQFHAELYSEYKFNFYIHFSDYKLYSFSRSK